MGKSTKRERKFNAKGGMKTALDKGTVTKKGKLRKRKKQTVPSHLSSNSKRPAETTENLTRRPDDFTSRENLGDLDLDDFFATVAESIEKEEEDNSVSSVEGEADLESDDEQAVGASKKPKQEDSVSDSDRSNSDDEDVDNAEARMKEEMAKMEKADPDFHKFLKENEESLLEFGDAHEENGEDNVDTETLDDEVIENEKEGEHRKGQPAVVLTPVVLKALYQGTFVSHGVTSLKKLVSAYRAACHLADSTSEDDKKAPREDGKDYIIESSKVFDQLMLLCLNRCHEEFRFHLLGEEKAENEEEITIETTRQESDENKPINPSKLSKSGKWDNIRPIILSFFRSTLHVLDEAKEPELVTVIVKALSKYIPFLSAFERIAEGMLKALTALWSAPLDSSEDYQVVRLNAFFRIRQLALTQPFPFVETCLKKIYLAYARRAKLGVSSSATTAMPTLTFMGNCLVELYSLDYHSSYQHAFVYIRQLALLLRAAMQKKTKESFQQVFCWQYVHCLKLWVAVLSQAAPTDDGAMMRSLIFPLTEIIQGTCRLVPAPVRHVPMRFHYIRLLQQLAAASESFIPTTSFLLECLDWKEWYLSPKKVKGGGGATRGLQMQYLLKLGKDDALRTQEQLEPAISEWFVLMQREIELYRYSAGFPEFSIRIVQRLKLFCKETRNARWRTYARGCIDTCDRYRVEAVAGRAKLQEAPKDVNRLECLRPHGVPAMGNRLQADIDKEAKALQASQSAVPSVKNCNKRKSDDGPEQDAAGNEEDKTESKSTKRRRKKKEAAAKKNQNQEYEIVGEEVLEQKDQVKEGIDWSDDED